MDNNDDFILKGENNQSYQGNEVCNNQQCILVTERYSLVPEREILIKDPVQWGFTSNVMRFPRFVTPNLMKRYHRNTLPYLRDV
jgi:hypothetical protein